MPPCTNVDLNMYVQASCISHTDGLQPFSNIELQVIAWLTDSSHQGLGMYMWCSMYIHLRTYCKVLLIIINNSYCVNWESRNYGSKMNGVPRAEGRGLSTLPQFLDNQLISVICPVQWRRCALPLELCNKNLIGQFYSSLLSNCLALVTSFFSWVLVPVLLLPLTFAMFVSEVIRTASECASGLTVDHYQ